MPSRPRTQSDFDEYTDPPAARTRPTTAHGRRRRRRYAAAAAAFGRRPSSRCSAACCSTTPRWDKISDYLRGDDFYRHDHRLIFEHIARLIDQTRPADVITVFDALTSSGKIDEVGGLVYLNALAQNTPSAANIRRYAEIVRGRSVMRRLVSVATRSPSPRSTRTAARPTRSSTRPSPRSSRSRRRARAARRASSNCSRCWRRSSSGSTSSTTATTRATSPACRPASPTSTARRRACSPAT